MEQFLVNLTTVILLFTFFILLRTTYIRFKEKGFSVAHAGVGALFFFLGLPILLDVLFGPGNFSNYRGFHYALNSPEASLYYNIYITYVCLVFYFYIRGSHKIKRFNFDTQNFYKSIVRFKIVFWILLVLPIFIVVFFSPRPEEYFNYQVTLLNRDQEFRDGHVYVFRAALIAVVSACFLFFSVKKNLDVALVGKYLIIIFFLFLAFWLDGKRGIFFKFFFVFLVIGILMGKIQPRKLFKYLITGLSILTVVVLLYGKDFASNNRYGRDAYTSLRLNIGRDHTVKYTLYKEYVENDMILEHRGQSFLFAATFFIPRDRWVDKPYPYAVYFVSSVINVPPEPQGWSFTTCILEEMISNLGFIGMVVAPFFLLWICKVGDRADNKFLTVIATMCVVFYLFTQMAAFLPILILFIILLIREKFKKVTFK